MDRGSEFRTVRSGSFSIADILNKNPCEPTGNFSVQTRLPEMNSGTTTKSEEHVAKAADKLDFEDNSAQGKQHMFAEIDADTNLVSVGAKYFIIVSCIIHLSNRSHLVNSRRHATC